MSQWLTVCNSASHNGYNNCYQSFAFCPNQCFSMKANFFSLVHMSESLTLGDSSCHYVVPEVSPITNNPSAWNVLGLLQFCCTTRATFTSLWKVSNSQPCQYLAAFLLLLFYPHLCAGYYSVRIDFGKLTVFVFFYLRYQYTTSCCVHPWTLQKKYSI